ncbi:MAG: S-layer homology domain-containing protein [Propionibacteriaceae bacterium]|jgi:hypothetical protein|nr:S-layer homology domain-containing protein [Propionibacteriaceae bacterium]
MKRTRIGSILLASAMAITTFATAAPQAHAEVYCTSPEPNCTILDWTGRGIESIIPGSLSMMSDLEEVRLDGNRLTQLELGTFAGLHNLKYVYLRYNQLTTLPLGLFDQNPQLREVFLEGNPWDCLPPGFWDGKPTIVHSDYPIMACFIEFCTGYPVISGSIRVGQPLSITGFDCDEEAEYAYTWEIGGNVVGTEATYTPTAADAGQRVMLTVDAMWQNEVDSYIARTTRQVRWFIDVPSTQRFYEAINYLAERNIISHGATNDEFHPDRTLTRGEIAAYMYRLAGRPQFSAPATGSFTDVPKTHMFYSEIEWLKTTGITSGKGSPTTFKPSDTATRGELAAFLHRLDIYLFGNQPFTMPPTPSFTDVPKTHTFNWDVEWMLAKGITSPNAQYHPERECLRDEFAAFMYRYMTALPPVDVVRY